MEEIKFKIKHTEAANVEICPVEDGVEIIVKYGSKKPSYSLHTDTDEPQVTYKSKSKWGTKKSQKSPEEIIDEMKAAARIEYKKPGADKDELTKFVQFWEKKINEDGWKGNKFDFDTLYDRWLSNKR